MSKLDPTSESLESILASIRRGLAEQSTDVLTEDGAQQPVSLDTLGSIVPGDEPPPRFLGGAGTEAPRQPQVPLPTETPLPAGFPVQTDQAFAGLDDPPPPASMSAALARGDEASRPPAPAAIPAPPQPEGAPKDPLWFLARGKDGVPPPTPGGAPQPVPAQPLPAQPIAPAALAPAPTAAPKPAAKETALKEIVRGPLPPFFGSSPETSKVEVSPAPPTASVPLPGTAVIPPAAPPPAPVARAAEAEPQRSAAPVRSSAPAREAQPSGKANPSVHVPPTAGSTTQAAASTPHLQGLDAMVAELLRPMLRQWLDENMPRLVSAALKAEAESQSRRDPRKP
ncbi:MAG TPA: DUF2497 domain-containing protein [Hyphomicrobiaceae bacterium]|jgi:cell pole-organizing protein PopZ|nr:DUF2497 domain-containing protein [Hyphomicrobiaceae bacterium]